MGASASVAQVSEELERLNPSPAYAQYAQAATEHGIDGTTAQLLTDGDLDSLGVKPRFHRARILHHIHDVAATVGGASASPTSPQRRGCYPSTPAASSPASRRAPPACTSPVGRSLADVLRAPPAYAPATATATAPPTAAPTPAAAADESPPRGASTTKARGRVQNLGLSVGIEPSDSPAAAAHRLDSTKAKDRVESLGLCLDECVLGPGTHPASTPSAKKGAVGAAAQAEVEILPFAPSPGGGASTSRGSRHPAKMSSFAEARGLVLGVGDGCGASTDPRIPTIGVAAAATPSAAASGRLQAESLPFASPSGAEAEAKGASSKRPATVKMSEFVAKRGLVLGTGTGTGGSVGGVDPFPTWAGAWAQKLPFADDAGADARASTKPDAEDKSEAKVEEKPGDKPDDKPGDKTVASSVRTPEAKLEAKSEAKSEAPLNLEAKSQAKESEPSEPESRPEPKPAATSSGAPVETANDEAPAPEAGDFDHT